LAKTRLPQSGSAWLRHTENLKRDGRYFPAAVSFQLPVASFCFRFP
jgi:hypothetical protein